MFFQAVKFLLACIFLENESIFHFSFFFLERSLCPSCKVVPGRNIHRNTTLKQTYFHTWCKREPGLLEPILGEQGNETIYGKVLPFQRARFGESSQCLFSYENGTFYMKTTHTTWVATTPINILWIIKYVCIKAKNLQQAPVFHNELHVLGK